MFRTPFLLSSAVVLVMSAGTARAADVAPLPRDWSGLYAGFHVGVASGIETSLQTRASTQEYETRGTGLYQCYKNGDPFGDPVEDSTPCPENGGGSDDVTFTWQKRTMTESVCNDIGGVFSGSGNRATCTVAVPPGNNIEGTDEDVVLSGQFSECTIGDDTYYYNNASQQACAKKAAANQDDDDDDAIYTSEEILETVAGSLLGAADKVSNDGDANFLAGINLGYNMQHDAFVFGVEADISSLMDGTEDLSSSADSRDDLPLMKEWANDPYITTSAEGEFGLSAVATLRARLGYDIDGTWLPFITGGLAWGKVSTKGTVKYSGEYGVPSEEIGPSCYCGDDFSATHRFGDTDWEMGWTLGAGINYRIADNAFLGLTYLYTDLGEHRFNDSYRDEDLNDEGAGTVLEGGVEGEVDAKFHSVRLSFDVLF